MASRFDKLVMTGLAAAAINNLASAYFSSGFPTDPAEKFRSKYVYDRLPLLFVMSSPSKEDAGLGALAYELPPISVLHEVP